MKIVGVVATGVACHTKVRHEFIPAENDKTFTVSFWAKVDAKEGTSRKVEISIQSPDEEWPGFYSTTITLNSTDWKEYTRTFTLENENLLGEIRVGLCVAQSDIDFWIDDFRFFEDVPKAVNPSGKAAFTWGRIKR